MFDYKVLESSDELLVTVEEAKTQCRVYDDYDLAYLETLLKVSQEIVEKYLNRELLTSTVQIQTDRVDMKLPRGLANSVTEVSFENALVDDGTRTVLEPEYYNFDDISGKVNFTKAGRDYLLSSTPFRFRVKFTTGWSIDEVPQTIKHAILLLTSTLYENRESAVVGSGITVSSLPVNHTYLLDKYKINRIG